MRRAVWRFWLRWRFRLFQRHRHRRLALEWVGGKPFLVLPEVFNPGLFPTGAFLAQQVSARRLPPDAAVLDMGAGAGIGAVFAAEVARRVVAVDINPEAARCARINALLNRVEDRVAVCEGDLFEPVQGQRFDLVLFNPPFYQGEPRGLYDHAWHSPDVVERFAAALAAHLTPGGCALVVLSTNGRSAAHLQAFRDHDLCVETVAERDMISEVLTVHELRPRRAGGR